MKQWLAAVLTEPAEAAGPSGGASTARSGFAALAGLALLTAALFAPVLFSSGVRVLGSPALDGYYQYVPWRSFGFGQLRQGHLALWNPHIFSGAPYFGSFQSALLYPPNVLFLVLPLGPAINWSIALHVFLAGAFTYLWTRRRGLHPLASFLSALTFMLCGAHFLHIFAGHLSNLCTLVWAPLLFLAIDRLCERPSLGGCLLGMFAVAMQVLAGHPQYVFYTGVAAGCYTALCAWRTGQRSSFAPGVAAVVAGGFALSAVQLLTGLAESRETFRSAGLSYRYAALFSFPPENLLTLLAPGFFGDMRTCPYWGRCALWETSFFLSVTSLALAVVGAVWGGRDQRRFALVMVVVLTILALGSHTPCFRLLYHGVPGFDKFRGSAKFLFLASLFLALLAGAGLDALLKGFRLPRACGAVAAGLAVLLAIGGLWLQTAAAGVLSADPSWWHRVLLAVRNTGESMLPPAFYDNGAFLLKAALGASHSLLIAAATFAALAVLFFLARTRRYALPLLVVLCMAELFWFARGSLDTFPVRDPAAAQVRQTLAANPGDYRILYCGNPNAAMRFGAQDIWGYDPAVLRRYAELLGLTQGLDPEDVDDATVLSRYHRLYAMLRCRYKFAPVEGKIEVAEATNALPHLALISHCQVIARRDDIFTALTNRAFNPRTEVILETVPDPEPRPAANPGTAKLTDSGTDYLTIEADVLSPSILLVTDTYAKGWRVRPLAVAAQTRYDVLPANYCLRAIPLAAGHHRFRLEYHPAGFALGAGVSVASLVGWLGLLCLCYRRRRAY